MEGQPKKSVDASLLETDQTFESFGFDDRLLKAIYHQGWSKPSLVQASAIPLALEGNYMAIKSLVSKERTSSQKLKRVQEKLLLTVCPSFKFY